MLPTPMNLRDYAATLRRLRQHWTELQPGSQRQALEWIQEMEMARERIPLRFFIPNGAQEKLIRTVGKREDFIVVTSYPNGVGKTACVFAILAAIMWPPATSAFDYPFYREWPFGWPKRIRIATEPELVADDGPIQTESAKWWPKGRYEWTRGGHNFNKRCWTDTDFSIEVLTYDQKKKAFEGKTVAINVFVEPPPKDKLDASIARTRMGGINLLDMTPLADAAHIKDDIVDRPVIRIAGRDVGKAACLGASIEDACRIHGKNGHLEHDHILQMVSRYDPDEFNARAFGEWQHLIGSILKGFDREVHVRKMDPEGKSIRGQIVDPAIAKPLASIWAWVDQTGHHHVYDEWPNFDFHGAKDSNLDVKQYAGIFREKEADNEIQKRILDRHFGNARRTLGGKTLKQEFAAAGLHYTDSYALAPDVEVETGILKFKEFLAYDRKKPLCTLNFPRLTIDPSCHNFIRSIERWSRNPKTHRPQEDYKDFADLGRYLVMAGLRVEAPRQWGSAGSPHYGVGNG